jgi:hypothetical protein
MDNAVALVQAYLHVNGYFTVSEYPVIEVVRHGGYRTVTDLDILAFRFPGAGRLIPRSGSKSATHADEQEYGLDPALGIPAEQSDMLIGEVKEGRAELNEGARDPLVLRTALARFGCCSPAEAGNLAESLLRKGHTILPSGHRLRMVAFGAVREEDGTHTYDTLSMGHVVRFLQEYLRQHWDVLRHAQFKDPAFGFLMTLEKALQGAA